MASALFDHLRTSYQSTRNQSIAVLVEYVATATIIGKKSEIIK